MPAGAPLTQVQPLNTVFKDSQEGQAAVAIQPDLLRDVNLAPMDWESESDGVLVPVYSEMDLQNWILEKPGDMLSFFFVHLAKFATTCCGSWASQIGQCGLTVVLEFLGKSFAASRAGGTPSLDEFFVTHGVEDVRMAGTASQAVQEFFVEVAGQPALVPDEDLEAHDISAGVTVPVSLETGQGFQEEPGSPLRCPYADADQNVCSFAN